MVDGPVFERDASILNVIPGKINPLLRLAAISGVETAVKLHIRRGDDLDAIDSAGATALMLAAGKKKAGVVRLLLESGANPALRDVDGRDALAYAKVAGCAETIELLTKAMPLVEVDSLDSGFADDWEVEIEPAAPQGDDTVADAARLVHRVMAQHKPLDGDADWEDVDLYLPERAHFLNQGDDSAEVRALLLSGLRNGFVPMQSIIAICTDVDGFRNKEAERQLGFIIGDLGANVTEWIDPEETTHDAASTEEEHLLVEAQAFVEDLASGRNEPFRFYSMDIRGELLEAEEEISLGREMEEGRREALSALARWTSGLTVLFEAAEEVARGAADPGSFCTGSDFMAYDEATFQDRQSDEEGEDEAKPVSEAAAFVVAVAGVRASGRNVGRVVDILNSVHLSRDFLNRLAERASVEPEGREFAEAVRRQSAARERMTVCNLRLALSIAKRYQWSGLLLDDLVQEANIGLMKAVEHYDWRRGFRFSTYATWWIRQQVTRSIADKSRLVRAPVHVWEGARKILQERKEVEAGLGRTETESETARRIGMPLARTRLLLSVFDEVVSLDEADPETGFSGVDLLADPGMTDPAEHAELGSLRAVLLDMLRELDDRSREIIVLRFGLDGDEARTLEEIGCLFNVTRERIRQIESKALGKLSMRKRKMVLEPWFQS